MSHRHAFTALSQPFIVDSSYDLVKELGRGAYGCVVATRHRQTGEGCAIKKITSLNTKSLLMKRCLREIRLLQHFRGHPNIMCLYDMDIVLDQNDNFNDVYLYSELMEADLNAIIRSGQPLSDEHYQSFIYQTLCGLKYIHSANVLHRDLKPGNLIVNARCELKITDFGLARGYSPGLDERTNRPADQKFLTEYVATRWYRAPEIMLSVNNYGQAIDLWSTGCILAELLGGVPIFQGRDYVDQLNRILRYLGTPSEETLHHVGSPRAQEYIRSLPFTPAVPFAALYPTAKPQALDLLQRLLCFDPTRRITCLQALEHPYFRAWHREANEPICSRPVDFSFEDVDDMDGMKKLIYSDVVNFRALVRSQAQAASPSRQTDVLPLSSPASPAMGQEPSPATMEAHRAAGGLMMEDPNEELINELSSLRG